MTKPERRVRGAKKSTQEPPSFNDQGRVQQLKTCHRKIPCTVMRESKKREKGKLSKDAESSEGGGRGNWGGAGVNFSADPRHAEGKEDSPGLEGEDEGTSETRRCLGGRGSA